MPMLRKIDFQPILMDAPERDTSVAALSIYKNGQMQISKAANHKYGMDGMAVEFTYAPTQRALGMKRVFHEFESSSWDKKKMRLLKQMDTGQIKVPVGRIMKKLGLEGIDFTNLEVEKHVDSVDGRDTYYVILPKKNKAEVGNGDADEQRD